MKISPDLERACLDLAGGPGRGVSLPAAPAARVRVAHATGHLNKTERAYADLLDCRKRAGEVSQWWFEALKLRLADRTWFTPDFLVMLPDGTLEMHEVKGGYVREDSAVKLKVAAAQYPIFRFVLAQKKEKQWLIRVVPA